MTVKEEIHRIVVQMSDEQANDVLAYLRSIAANDAQPDDESPRPLRVSAEEALQLANAKPLTMEDPLWDLVGIAGTDEAGPTDVSTNKHAYLADAYADLHRE